MSPDQASRRRSKGLRACVGYSTAAAGSDRTI
jgi:hypothetical protein